MESITPMAGHLHNINSILSDNLPWFPLNFVREIAPAMGRAWYADSLTKSLSAKNDLRVIWHPPDLDRLYAVFAEVLPWDSAFFGYSIARINAVLPLSAPYFSPREDYAELLCAFTKYAKERGIKYLFTTVSSTDIATLRGLCRAGYELIETRVYYQRDLATFDPAERYNVRQATGRDVPLLGATAKDCVNVFDRFHADPFICPADADRMMYKWVQASVEEGFADITFVPDSDQPQAFFTAKFHSEMWEHWGVKLSQLVLSAVGPDFRGWNKKLISEAGLYLRDQIGAEHIYVCTQAANTKVVWVCESLGYHLGKVEQVFRIVL